MHGAAKQDLAVVLDLASLIAHAGQLRGDRVEFRTVPTERSDLPTGTEGIAVEVDPERVTAFFAGLTGAAVLGANYPGTDWYSRAYKLVKDNPPATIAPVPPGTPIVPVVTRPAIPGEASSGSPAGDGCNGTPRAGPGV